MTSGAFLVVVDPATRGIVGQVLEVLEDSYKILARGSVVTFVAKSDVQVASLASD